MRPHVEATGRARTGLQEAAEELHPFGDAAQAHTDRDAAGRATLREQVVTAWLPLARRKR